jgi:hypothetical protein
MRRIASAAPDVGLTAAEKNGNLRQPRGQDLLRVTHAHAAGIDVDAAVHWMSVPPGDVPPPGPDHPLHLPPHLRSFGACTAGVNAPADWLTPCGVTSVAMESTGISWIPLFELLEARGFEVFLIEPRQARHAPGRPKYDVRDCQWLQRCSDCTRPPVVFCAKLSGSTAALYDCGTFHRSVNAR